MKTIYLRQQGLHTRMLTLSHSETFQTNLLDQRFRPAASPGSRLGEAHKLRYNLPGETRHEVWQTAEQK